MLQQRNVEVAQLRAELNVMEQRLAALEQGAQTKPRTIRRAHAARR
jgi:hypothetical protein